MEASEAFEKIAQAMLVRAAQVRCSSEEHRDGLRGMIEMIQIEIAASEELGDG